MTPTRELYESLCGLLAEENVVLTPKRSERNGNGNGRYYSARRARQQTAFAPSGQGPG